MTHPLTPMAAFAACALLAAPALSALDYRIDVSSSVSWERGELTVRTVFDLASAGLKMPTGRSQAEVFAEMEFPRLARPTIYRIPVDSSTTVESMVESGAIAPAELGAIAAAAARSPAVLSGDQRSLTSSYRIDLRALAASLVKHRRAAAPPRTLEPRATRAYTGIIIYANEELPVHGTRSRSFAAPCFFPKIWDAEMNLLYERNMADPEVARRSGIVHYGSALDEARYADRIGRSPLRILARGLFGMLPTDPIIDRDDAMKIISSDENRALLNEGRVVIVLNEKAIAELR